MKAIGDLLRALRALEDPRFWRVAAKSVILTALSLAGSFWALGALLGVGGDYSFSLPWIGEVAFGGDVSGALWVLAALIGSAFLMAPIAAAFASLFADEVSAAVEARDYPGQPPAKPAPLAAQIRAAAGLFLAMIGWNLLALPCWIVMPPAAPFVYIAVNGWLLGREYLETIAMRRMSRADAVALRKAHAGQVWVMGGIMAASLALPLTSLFAPLLGAAAATHMFHRLSGRRAGGANTPPLR